MIYDARGGPLGGPANWSAASCRRRIRARSSASSGDPIVDLKPPPDVTPEQQRARLDLLAKLNEIDMQKYPGSSELAARISSYELAYRMQGCAPEARRHRHASRRPRASCTAWTTRSPSRSAGSA